MEFYKIWSFRGMIGVNKLTLTDVLIGVPLMSIIVYMIILAFSAPIAPALLTVFYIGSIYNSDGTNLNAIKQRLGLNLLTIVSVIYYLLDFHYGWLSFSILSTVVSPSGMNTIAETNLILGLVAIFYFFFGHQLFYGLQKFRKVVFLLIGYVLIWIAGSVSHYVITNMITPSTKEYVIKYTDDSPTDQDRLNDKNKRELEEAKRDAKMKQYDNVGYINGLN